MCPVPKLRQYFPKFGKKDRLRMEIEKKFQVKVLPEHLEQYAKKEIEQGYLCTQPVIRIRKSDDRYILTYKSGPLAEALDADVRVNQEVEVPLTQEAYAHLREKADNHLIIKTRYVIPLPDGHVGELDIFHGRLDGLYFIEVEFSDEEDAGSFAAPEWFGKNVSQDERYANSFLSRCDNLDVFRDR
jgi:CYTH domain-containing protein